MEDNMENKNEVFHRGQENSSKVRNGSGNGTSDVTNDTFSNGIHGNKQQETEKTLKKGNDIARMVVCPLLMISLVPNAIIIIWYTVAHCEGSYLTMLDTFRGRSILMGLPYIWSLVNYPTAPIVGIILGYAVYALVMMKLLPGKTVYGPVTPKGNVPEYKDNGFAYYILTIALFWILTVLLRPYGISPSIIYDRFDEVLYFLNLFSLAFCAMLYIKGKYAPSTSDSGSSGNIVFDYYWGMELYPRIMGLDIKVFTNCRFGMMSWAVLACVHAVKSYELYGFVDSMFVSVFLQLLYITKFFWWEAGYMRTIDIMLDRAGFYICWGCLVFIPGFYASVSYYLVKSPVTLGPSFTIAFVLLGALSIYINFNADDQKQVVRNTDANCLIWGRKPDIIRAKYQLQNGEERESILLASGWWGMSRHFHYIPEIMLAFFWTVPALGDNLMPYSYVIYLIILLTHRSFRDEAKCSQKYAASWTEYCKKVPYKIVPGLF